MIEIKFERFPQDSDLFLNWMKNGCPIAMYCWWNDTIILCLDQWNDTVKENFDIVVEQFGTVSPPKHLVVLSAIFHELGHAVFGHKSCDDPKREQREEDDANKVRDFLMKVSEW